MGVGTLWTPSGLEAVLAAAGPTVLTGCTVGLFVVDHTPALGDDYTTYSIIEAGWTGYARQTLTFGSAGNDGTEAFVDMPTQTFTVTSGGTGQTAYGYFVLTAGGALLYAERVVTPASVVDGVPILLDSQLGLRNP